MTAIDMTPVSNCTVSACSFNDNGCHAFAVTVGEDANCATFIPLDVKGGISKVVTQVGACQRVACAFNKNLECTATQVRIGSGGTAADCLSYTE
ncbi:DUF1540 domain-containing protein [Dermabacteraceae bacterium P7074]